MKESRKKAQEESLKATRRQIENPLSDSSYYPTSDTTQETSEKRSSEFDKKLLEKCRRQIVQSSALPPSFDPANEPTPDDNSSFDSQTFISNLPPIHQQIEIQPIPFSNAPPTTSQVGLIPQPWQEQRPLITTISFDFRKCWENLRDIQYPQVPIQSLAVTFINLCLQSKYTDTIVVKSTLASSREISGFVCDQMYKYHLLSKSWGANDFSVQGNGCLSLRKQITGDNETKVIEDIAKIFGMKLSNSENTQLDSQENLTWIQYPETYRSSPPSHHPVFGIFGPNPTTYPFYTESGQPSFLLMEWQVENKSFRLFYTLTHDNSIEQTYWEFIAPPTEHRVFNKHLVFQLRSSKVWIHDQIGRAYQYSTTDLMSVHTWAGDLPWASKLNWEFLRGRDVSFVFDMNNRDSVEIGAELIQKFKEFATGITFLPVNDQGNSEILTEELSAEQFYEASFKRHGHDFRHKKSRSKVFSRDLDEHPVEKNIPIDWIVEPLIRSEDFVLLSAGTGVGKTFLAIDIGLMIATGESIVEWLKVKVPQSVLFIDTELSSNTFIGRCQKIKINYSNPELTGNFSYVSISDNRTKLNLLETEDQEWVENEISERNPRVVIIDNLGGIMPYQSEQDPKKWEIVSKFIKSLNKRKIAVLLVHHFTKLGESRGTNKILDDSDLAIRLESPKKPIHGKKLIKLSFDKVRHFEETQQFPLTIEYVSESGKMRRIVKSLDSIADPSPSATSAVSQGEIIRHKLSPFEIEILTIVRTSEKRWLSIGIEN